MLQPKHFTLLTTSLLAAACAAPADEFRAALPSESDVTVEVPEQTSQSTNGLARQPIVGEPAEFYTNTYYEARNINDFGRFVVDLVETITSYPATAVTEDAAVWGPFSEPREPNEFRLTVERHDAPALHYTWALEGRPKSATDFTGLAGGDFEPSEVADQGRGWFVVDFEAIRALDPSEDGRGQIAYAFDKGPNGVAVRMLVQSFDDQGDVVHGGYAFGQSITGEGYVIFAFPSDIHEDDPTKPAPEDLLIRSQWTASGAGRADVVARNGDLGPQTVYVAQCWDDTFVSTFELFTLDGTILGAQGDPSTCELEEETPEALPTVEDVANPFEGGR